VEPDPVHAFVNLTLGVDCGMAPVQSNYLTGSRRSPLCHSEWNGEVMFVKPGLFSSRSCLSPVNSFWATVCKTVCLRHRTIVCLILSVCLSLCDVAVLWPKGWIRIRMSLGMEEGLGPCHIVLDGEPAPPAPTKRGHISSTHFSAHVYIVAKRLVWSRYHLARR